MANEHIRMGGSYGALSARNLRGYFGEVGFPANRRDLIAAAEGNDASDEIIALLKHLPDKKYKSFEEVVSHFVGPGHGLRSVGAGAEGMMQDDVLGTSMDLNAPDEMAAYGVSHKDYESTEPEDPGSEPTTARDRTAHDAPAHGLSHAGENRPATSGIINENLAHEGMPPGYHAGHGSGAPIEQQTTSQGSFGERGGQTATPGRSADTHATTSQGTFGERGAGPAAAGGEPSTDIGMGISGGDTVIGAAANPVKGGNDYTDISGGLGVDDANGGDAMAQGNGHDRADATGSDEIDEIDDMQDLVEHEFDQAVARSTPGIAEGERDLDDDFDQAVAGSTPGNAEGERHLEVEEDVEIVGRGGERGVEAANRGYEGRNLEDDEHTRKQAERRGDAQRDDARDATYRSDDEGRSQSP